LSPPLPPKLILLVKSIHPECRMQQEIYQEEKKCMERLKNWSPTKNFGGLKRSVTPKAPPKSN
uniref:Uncharacterized protein n=1 Tax=Laticauda laticaudata TaxID=8630 RepID=A0A8C5RD73_LATLA